MAVTSLISLSSSVFTFVVGGASSFGSSASHFHLMLETPFHGAVGSDVLALVVAVKHLYVWCPNLPQCQQLLLLAPYSLFSLDGRPTRALFLDFQCPGSLYPVLVTLAPQLVVFNRLEPFPLAWPSRSLPWFFFPSSFPPSFHFPLSSSSAFFCSTWMPTL